MIKYEKFMKKKLEKSNQKILRKRFNCPTNGVRDGQTTRISQDPLFIGVQYKKDLTAASFKLGEELI